MITQERLRELLTYDPETGLFTRNVRMANCAAGTIAGGRRAPGGYIFISVDDKQYRAHLLAWFYMTGEWPEKFIDHEDTDKGNNRWRNLREATKSQNQANTRAPRTNTSGFKGVSRYRAGESYGKPWQAGIQKDGRVIHIGHFATAEAAHAAYAAKAIELFGAFARAA